MCAETFEFKRRWRGNTLYQHKTQIKQKAKNKNKTHGQAQLTQNIVEERNAEHAAQNDSLNDCVWASNKMLHEQYMKLLDLEQKIVPHCNDTTVGKVNNLYKSEIQKMLQEVKPMMDIMSEIAVKNRGIEHCDAKVGHLQKAADLIQEAKDLAKQVTSNIPKEDTKARSATSSAR